MPRVGVKKKGSVEDRESGVALCHGVALKKKKKERKKREIGRGLIERSRSVPQGGVKKKRERSVEDRESSIALCHGVAFKKKDRSRTERAESLCATGWDGRARQSAPYHWTEESHD